MSLYLVTLDNGISGEFEADSEQAARDKAQAAIDAYAPLFPDETPPTVVSVEVING